jgi:hypothetical protein
LCPTNPTLTSELYILHIFARIAQFLASFWLTAYLLCFVDVFFNKQSTFMWVPIKKLCSSSRRVVPLFLWDVGDFVLRLLKTSEEKKFAWSFNFTFLYINDVFSQNNSKFVDFAYRFYPIDLEIKDTTDTTRSASLHVPTIV